MSIPVSELIAFRDKPLADIVWTSSETLTVGGSTGTVTGWVLLTNLSDNVIWVSGDGTAAATDGSHGLPIPANAVYALPVYASSGLRLAGTASDALHVQAIDL